MCMSAPKVKIPKTNTAPPPPPPEESASTFASETDAQLKRKTSGTNKLKVDLANASGYATAPTSANRLGVGY